MAEEQSSKRPRGTESSAGSTRPPEKRLETMSSIPEKITSKLLTASPTRDSSLSPPHRPWLEGGLTLSPTATESLGRGTEPPRSPGTKRHSVLGIDRNRSESAGGNSALAHLAGSTSAVLWFVFSEDLPFDRHLVLRRSTSKSTLSSMAGKSAGGSAGDVLPSRAATETSAQISAPEGEYVAARLEHLVEQGVQVSPSSEGRHQLVTLGLGRDTYGLEITGGKSLPEEVEGFEEYLSLGTRVVLDHTAFSMLALSSLHQLDEGTKNVLREQTWDYLVQEGRRHLDHTYQCNRPPGLVSSHHALRDKLDKLVEELESGKLTRLRSVHWWADGVPMWEVFSLATGEAEEQSRGAYTPPEYEATPGDSFAGESTATLPTSEPGSQTHDPAAS